VKLALLFSAEQLVATIPDLVTKNPKTSAGTSFMDEFKLKVEPGRGLGPGTVRRTLDADGIQKLLADKPVELIVEKKKPDENKDPRKDKDKDTDKDSRKETIAVTMEPRQPNHAHLLAIEKLEMCTTLDPVTNTVEMASRDFAAAKRLGQMAGDACGKATD
jgi:hypothetical protein